MAANAAELRELGLRVPGAYAISDEVPLAAFPNLSYTYDEVHQTIDIDIAPEHRLPKTYDALGLAPPIPTSVPTTGAVLDYLLFGGAGSTKGLSQWQVQGLSATLDARFFSPIGVLSQSGIVGSNPSGGAAPDRLRLDTTWTFTDPDHLATYRAGDTISGALAWTRPIRLGGFQIQRDFTLRPDFVTLPLPSVNGSAAVPSTVEVYIDNVRTLSRDVGNGPYSITNLPIFSGQGDANVILREPSGREVVTTLPFFVSSRLLRQGLYDFSAEAGFPRLYYGSLSNVYAKTPAGSASLRYGLDDRVTLESHVEATAGLVNAGIGSLVGVDRIGLFSAAVTGSRCTSPGGPERMQEGGQAYLGFDTTVYGMSLSVSTQRSFGGYADLAFVSAPKTVRLAVPPVSFSIAPAVSPSYGQSLLYSARPPLIEDRAFLGFPLPFRGGSVNFGLTRLKYSDAPASTIVTASFTRQIFDSGSFVVSAFGDLDHRKNTGAFLGLSIALGNDITAAATATFDQSGSAIGAQVIKPLRAEPGSVGWQITDTEGKAGQRLGRLDYLGQSGQVSLTAGQSKASGTYGTATAEGAIVMADGGLFLGNRIDDSFAIVNAGTPGVDVLYENRPIAQTDANGKALVPTLHAYQANKLSIDPRKLPLDASIASTQEIVSPPRRSGVTVDFGIKPAVPSAIVVFHGSDGRPLRAGLRGSLASGQGFVVGYDGRAFIEGLQTTNLATVLLPEGECRAEFGYTAQSGVQVVIGPVACA